MDILPSISNPKVTLYKYFGQIDRLRAKLKVKRQKDGHSSFAAKELKV